MDCKPSPDVVWCEIKPIYKSPGYLSRPKCRGGFATGRSTPIPYGSMELHLKLRDMASPILNLLKSIDIRNNSCYIFYSTAPYPSGKGEVCKTFMHRFESGRRLYFTIFLYQVYATIVIAFIKSPVPILLSNSFTGIIFTSISSSSSRDCAFVLTGFIAK